MMVDNPNAVRRSLAPATAAVAVLALAGCAATHVGEDWQCPLAQGAHCASVAGADPMVPLAGAGPLARGGPLAGDGHRQDHRDEAGPSLPVTHTGRQAEDGGAINEKRDGVGRDCPVFCRPFGWLARVLARGGYPVRGGDGPEAAAEPSDASNPAADAAESGEPADGNPDSPNAGDPPPDAYVRLPETVGRVWIAPYVDAGGVYREASWVRVVVAPARWRRPR